MEEVTQDLSTTPAENTRARSRRGSGRSIMSEVVFKKPTTMLATTKGKQKFKTIADRKKDLMGKWKTESDKINSDTCEQQDISEVLNQRINTDTISKGDFRVDISKVQLKLASYVRRGNKNEDGQDDDISLGESASSSHKRSRMDQLTQQLTNAQQDYDKHDEDSEHDERASNGSTSGYSVASRSPDEQQLVEERRELENAKSLIPQDDTDIKELFTLIINKLTTVQLGLHEIKTEQHNISRRLLTLEECFDEVTRKTTTIV